MILVSIVFFTILNQIDVRQRVFYFHPVSKEFMPAIRLYANSHRIIATFFGAVVFFLRMSESKRKEELSEVLFIIKQIMSLILRNDQGDYRWASGTCDIPFYYGPERDACV